MTTLFVYGSLREGHANHSLLRDSEKVGGATIKALRQGPITVYEDGDEEVEGEVYRVDDDTLRHVDRLEGYDPSTPDDKQTGWVRKTTTATLESGEEVEVQYYPVVRRRRHA
jgi:gamma-glutamylcyclotransferase (GGCT)/AIG2-like uncharacterized protein YtfP